ncbi:TonB-dependent receptor [Janthinobacterium sp. PC23-8]|uniref:TonB-dependent receptor n=1 Tax=Janthinobacterium sp. PC23-8 TaxID=2012679 RepID=UPI000B96CB7C|nr:TonB-dependent receptor [Janthinobacterium sp. PC23-8]OYO26602.1 TonB-dependent receptor [Janthinobacterium sp. PC23-8]
MTCKHIPSPSLRLLCTAMLAASSQAVLAQTADDTAAPAMQRVEVTGSSIKRLVSETATPLSIFKADDFARQGLSTAQEVLSKIPSNASSMGSGNAVGGNTSGLPTGGQASADLRGLGGDKTLVLLNGRRIANHPYDGASVDLNIIPIAALDRVEVLRDGASAIYGTDAIGGVINFITKRSVNTTNITAEAVAPQHRGADEQRLNLSSGVGQLNTDGYNLFGVLDYHKQDVLTSQDRSFSSTGIIAGRGLSVTSGTTFPGNYFDAAANGGAGLAGNPYAASGCLPPLSVAAANGTCRQDYTRQIDDLPAQRQLALFGKGSVKLGGGHLATFEYLHSENKVKARTAPPPQIGLILPNSSPYYPGNAGGVPAQAGLSGQPLSVNWRPVAAGQRQIDSRGKADRLVLALEGELAGWDYQGAVSRAVSRSSEDFTGGYVQDAAFAAGVLNGILNPFGEQNAAGKDYLASTALRGEVQNAKVTTTGLDVKASRELMQLAGGPLALALGAELRREKAQFNVNREIAGQASSSGLSGSLSKAGERDIEAVFGELNLPLVKNLEVQLAARFDHYSDVGSTTNPKLGLRYQASDKLVLRGSASTGFRAPTLFEKNAPPSRNDTNDSYDDPILCPGGVPQPGANPLRDCDLQQYKLQGGNANLKPEKSTTFAVGLVFEPVREVTVALDYWNIGLKDKIASLPEQSIFGNYEKYKALFLRNPDGSPNAILDLNDNLGKVKTDGVDISVNARLWRGAYGEVSLAVDGTWIHKYDYQNERDGEFIHNVGRYADNNPVFRWKHTATLNWRSGAWGATVSQAFKSAYTDQNSVDEPYRHDVSSYSLVNVSGSYARQGWLLTAGVKNLFDREPPFSNQGTLFQKGYDPRYTDPVGRAWYLRGSYTF